MKGQIGRQVAGGGFDQLSTYGNFLALLPFNAWKPEKTMAIYEIIINTY
jgi:hypothetical protein